MSSSEPPAAGKPTATELDDKDETLLARFLAAGAQHLFEYPSKEEASGKKGKQDKSRRRANRDACNLSGGTFLRDAQAKLAPPPPAAAFSTHSSFGAAMTRKHGPVRRYDGSSQMRSNDPCPTSMQRASCVRDVPHNANASAGAPGLLPLARRSCSRPGVPRRSKLEGSRCRNRAFRTGTEHVAVRRRARERERRCVR